MEHQDFKPVIFGKTSNKEITKKISQKCSPENVISHW